MYGLCFLSKLVKQVIAKLLIADIDSNKFDSPRQAAYKPGHSTVMAILSINIEVHVSLAYGEPTALVLLNLIALFDTRYYQTPLVYLRSWFSGIAL